MLAELRIKMDDLEINVAQEEANRLREEVNRWKDEAIRLGIGNQQSIRPQEGGSGSGSSNDPLALSNSDNPGSQLLTTLQMGPIFSTGAGI